MDKSSIVSIDWVISELNLSDMPKAQAFKILSQYIGIDGLAPYFDEPAVGTDSAEGYEIIKDEKGDMTGALIANAYSETHTGRKQVLETNFWLNAGKYYLAVSHYKHGMENYFPTEETGMWLSPLSIDLDTAYFCKEEVREFKDRVLCMPTSSGQIRKTALGNEPGVRKALALLAREKAELSPSYRSGGNVNASAFKDHVLKLAKDYIEEEEPRKREYGLNSLDDKISDTLSELDIKEVSTK